MDLVTEELMMSDIELLGLTVRTKNLLNSENIYAVGQLLELTYIDLLKMPNMGKKSAREIESAMIAHGMSLRKYGEDRAARIVAIPKVEWSAFPSMTLRDYFAAQAMQGMLAYPGCESRGSHHNNNDPSGVAEIAYRYAEAMLAARSQS